MKKLLSFVIALIFILALLPSQSFASDIDNHSMKAELTYWANKGVLIPDAAGNYKPNKTITRGEFASMLARALKLPENKSYSFKDVKSGTQLANEISSAAAAGIITGYGDGTFKPDANVTRQHMAVMLYKALRYKEVPLKTAVQYPLTFKDKSSILKAYHDAVATNVHYNIIRGAATSGGTIFQPKNNATVAHAAAFLYRMQSTITKYGIKETPVEAPSTGEETVTPPVVDNTIYYYVGFVNNNQIVKRDTKYKTYAEAEAFYTSSAGTTLIFKGDTILRSKVDALAYAADYTAKTDITTVYLDKTLKNSFTYVVEGSELVYIGGNETYSTVKVGDVLGYVHTNQITIQPSATLVDRNYYYTSGGALYHRLYNHVKKASGGAYIVGYAPSFMTDGTKYYSMDAVNYTNAAGKSVGTYYNYYQFASVRKYTQYTAAELDTLINTIFKDLEKASPITYKDILTNSKLVGFGKFLKEVESEYKVNALFILAAAFHESGYGMSENAQKKNNLFGIQVFDGSPEDGTKYIDPKDSVYAFINEYVNKKYVPQSGAYSNGAVPGMKNTGMNVSYASDPFWGGKIASHMYRLDSKLKKEYQSANAIGMVLNGGNAVPVYKTAATTTLVYTYKAKQIGESGKFGYPVIIDEEATGTDGQKWYKIYSDEVPTAKGYTRFAWVQAKYVTKITTK